MDAFDTRGTRWLLLAAAALLLIVYVFPLSLGVPLIDPDEGLHAAIAQEMAERDDWVTPRFLGEPFLDKPILYTWVQAASLTLLGMNEAAVRLPGLVFGMLGALSTGLLAWRLFGRTTGLVAVILYSTMVLPTALAQVAAHDVALVPWVNLAILMFWEADRAITARRASLLAASAGVFLGLACLTKGLSGVAIVGVAYGSALVVTRRLSWASCGRGLLALIVAAAVAAAWFVAMEQRHPGYLSYYFIERHLLGFATQSQKHGNEPWWYYAPVLFGGGAPWIMYLPSALVDLVSGKSPSARPAAARQACVLGWCWIIVATVLLSASGSKLVTYYWPVFPAVAILTADLWVGWFDGRLKAGAARLFRANFLGSTAVGPAVLPIVMLLGHSIYGARYSAVVWCLAVAAGLSTYIALAFWRIGRPRQALAAGTLAIGVQFMVGLVAIAPAAAQVFTAHDLADYFNSRGSVPPQVVVVEERVGSVVFYLDPLLRAGLRHGQFDVVRVAELPRVARQAGDMLILVPVADLAEAESNFDFDGMSQSAWGRYRVYEPLARSGRPHLIASRGR